MYGRRADPTLARKMSTIRTDSLINYR